LASAEVGRAEVFLTCDDLVLRRAPRLGLALATGPWRQAAGSPISRQVK
jgi:hypothetical protein